MVTPELQKYISDSKASGMTEEQIRQSLLSQGWPESDISQVLPAVSSSASVTPLPAATDPTLTGVVTKTGTSWFTSKVIAVIFAIIVLLGGGSYFAYTKMKSKSGDSSGGILSSKSADNIDCRKLFPDSEFNRITGKNIADYNPKQDLDNLGTGADASASNDISELGKNYVSGQSGIDVEAAAKAGNARSINCYYVPKNPTEYEKQTLAISQLVLSPITITLGTNDVPGSIENNFTQNKNDLLKKNGTFVEFDGEKYPIAADATKDVPGIGASAYEGEHNVSFLSKSKKYIVSVTMDEKIATSDKLREAAKIVDTNFGSR